MRAAALSVLAGVLLAGCFSQQPAPTTDRRATAQSAGSAGPGYYTVKRGDTLYRIATAHGRDVRDVAAWNNIANPDSIREGQVLRVLPPGQTAGLVAGEGATAGVVPGAVTTATVESRPLDGPAVMPAPVAAADSGGVKREPRAGKEPYSDEAYARLNRTEGGAALPAASVPASAPTAPAATTPAEPARPAAAAESGIAWAWPTANRMTGEFSEAANKGLDFAGKAGDPVLAAAEGKVVYAGGGLRGYGQLVIVKHDATYLSAYAHNQKILVKEGQSVRQGQKIAEMGNTDADSVRLHFEIRKQGKPVDPAQFLPRR